MENGKKLSVYAQAHRIRKIFKGFFSYGQLYCQMQLLVLYLALQLDSLLDLLVVKTSCSALSAAILKEYYYCEPFLACHKTVFTSMITCNANIESFVNQNISSSFGRTYLNKQMQENMHIFPSQSKFHSFGFFPIFLQESESETLLIGLLRGERISRLSFQQLAIWPNFDRNFCNLSANCVLKRIVLQIMHIFLSVKV